MSTKQLTRDDLLKIITDAIRCHSTYLSERQAMAVVDTVLRNLKGPGVRLYRAAK